MRDVFRLPGRSEAVKCLLVLFGYAANAKELRCRDSGVKLIFGTPTDGGRSLQVIGRQSSYSPVGGSLAICTHGTADVFTRAASFLSREARFAFYICSCAMQTSYKAEISPNSAAA